MPAKYKDDYIPEDIPIISQTSIQDIGIELTKMPNSENALTNDRTAPYYYK